jgi:hypothetical protein
MTSSAPGPPVLAGFRFSRSEGFALLAVLALGLIHLPHPFDWDQSLFTLGAERLASGGVLYRDFWDVKQPGIYWFYTVGGWLFGFNEVGIHLFELLWMMAFALTLLVTLRRRWGPGPAATLAPLFTVGAYYAAAGNQQLTQVEGLVGLPLYLTLWFATDGRDEKPRAARAFLSGLCGAVVLIFKLVFLPLVGIIWLLALRAAARRGGARCALGSLVLPVSIGFALPLAVTLAYFARHDQLGMLVWTYFTYPAFLMSQARGLHAERLFSGLQWFLLRFAPLIGLATVGAGLTRSRRDALGQGLQFWFMTGILVILVQRLSWYSYHYQLLLPPLGVLGAAGAGALWSRLGRFGTETPRARRWAAAGLCALFAGLIGLAAMKVAMLAHNRFAITPADRLAYLELVDPSYRDFEQDVARLAEPGRRPGSLFVIDHPLFYRLAGRPISPAAFHGALFIQEMRKEEWSELTARLERDPPAYVLVERHSLPLVTGGAPRVASFAGFLAAGYRVAFTTKCGAWYERVR